MVPAAIRLKRLRERTQPRLTMRGMAELLGMPATSYGRYEDPNAFKKRNLPLDLARRIAAVMADHGVSWDEALELAGLGEDDNAAGMLTASEAEWLEVHRELSAGQRALLLQLAREMLGGREPVDQPTVHTPQVSYRGREGSRPA